MNNGYLLKFVDRPKDSSTIRPTTFLPPENEPILLRQSGLNRIVSR